jgi:hypothetical protein
MVRLLKRLNRHSAEPETLTGLVQVLRFCGLLKESVEMNKAAAIVDPVMVTSIPHTLFLMGKYTATIEAYGGRTSYYLDAAAWASLGETDRAAQILRERLARMPAPSPMVGLMESLLAALERRFDDAVRLMQANDITFEPEGIVYFARQYSFMGFADQAIESLRQAAQLGFVCSPETLKLDPWLTSVREHERFPKLLFEAERSATEAGSIFEQYVSKSPDFGIHNRAYRA